MQTRARDLFLTVKTEGGILPADLLARVSAEDPGLPGLRPVDYHLGKNERLNEAVTRSWNRLRGVWSAFAAERAELSEDDPGTTATRERWLLILFGELGYGRLPTVRAAEIEGKSYPISHRWQYVPLHLVGCNVGLEHRRRGVAGAASSTPHSLVQEYLNRSDDALWAFVSNGLTLRILRDNVSLTRQAYVEFDLVGMMEGEAFSDFKLLWLTCHQSRVEAERPEDCWLERWSKLSHEEGTRALDQLRDGVAQAIEILGAGFLSQPANAALRERLRSGQLHRGDYYRQLLRLVYRLLFLFVAEDRGLWPHPQAEPGARDLYLAHYSTVRLRRLAERRRGTRHADLWESFKVLQRLLENDEGCPALGLAAPGGFLWSARALPDLAECALSNRDLLEALRRVAFTEQGRLLRRVDYKNMGSEELGSVYESLLELHAELDIATGSFRLATAGGHERKTTGSYYTPPQLVQCLLDSALDPVIEACLARAAERVRGQGIEAVRREQERSLLDLRVCDPACGSGHFLIAAAHRLAAAVAAVRTGEGEPGPEAVRVALRDVVGRCLYGVDTNEMAVELCKVSLWLEALDPDRPLSFLENRIVCGNSLLGTTPALLAEGIPDAAFTVIRGDDKKFTATLKKQNKEERTGQGTLFAQFDGGDDDRDELRQQLTALEAIDDGTLSGLHRKEQAYTDLMESQAYLRQKLLADAWCAAFLWTKVEDAPTPVTQDLLWLLGTDPDAVPTGTRSEVERLARQYDFLHWHLVFPGVFGAEGLGSGFDVVLGNPPWERVKLQEKEWFATRVPEVAAAANASARKQLIKKLAEEDPDIFRAFEEDVRKAEGESHFLRSSGRYPLCGRGDVNTYSVFAETSRNLLSPEGRFGLILPTGIATDHTTAEYFSNLVESSQLAALYAFENEERIFPAVHHAFKFCLLVATGEAGQVEEAQFVWFARQADQVHDPARRFTLSPADIALLNPNTRTCPIFRSSRDAEINKAIYRRVPVLLREGPPEENPWGLEFMAMLHMSNDSGLFRTREELEAQGWCLAGNRFHRGEETYLPLYEAKMLHHFDHRFGTYEGQTEAQARMSKLPEATPEQHADPDFAPLPRYWVPAQEVEERLRGRWDRQWLLGFRDVCRNTDQRTVIASILPRMGVGHKAPLFFTDKPSRYAAALLGNLCSYAFDYLARQKLGGTSLSYFVLKQLPIVPPATMEAACPWEPSSQFGDWIAARVVELVSTSRDVMGFARDCGYNGPPFVWDEGRRLQLRCELDAAFFHLYSVSRDDVEYIMDTFPIVRREDEKLHGSYRTRDIILKHYDEMARTFRAPAGVRGG